ncbi:hypothetical protein [uncultured Clostridium sp.]|uniref:hypothetical protein n=1 Tax=uncultured Clostridium sp. TaxID=59620 RepID=UPI0026731690|nr:hypothetical protein [uncultured Clostridium sp.]
MKNFKEFETAMNPEKIQQISNKIIDKLDKINPKLDEFEFERSYNLSLTMRLLKEYHKWLND